MLLLDIVYALHYVYFAVEFLGLPIKCGQVTLAAADEQMATIACVIETIRTEFVQVEVEVLLSAEQVHVLDDIVLSDAFVVVLFFDVTFKGYKKIKLLDL